MRKAQLSVGCVMALVAVGGLAEGLAGQASPLGQLGWMAGCWERTTGERWLEEQWMSPRGDMMLGVSRTVRGDRVMEHEALRIEERDGRLVYVARPSGQAVAEFESTGVSDTSAVFENRAHDFPQRILYLRGAGDSLFVRIEGRRGEEMRGVDFRMARARCPQPSVPADATEANRAEVLDRLERYYADFSSRDWEAFASHFWPGATLTTVWQPPGADAPRVVVTDLDEFIALAPQGPGSREIFEERMLGAKVLTHGNLAQVWARYEARFGDPGEITEWRGIDAFTLMRHDGEWRIVSLSFTDEEER